MAGQYFYARGEEQFGPFSGARLKELAAAGRLEPTDIVWRHGMKKRVPAGAVRELFPAAHAAARPDDTDIPAAKALPPTLLESAPAPPDTRRTPVEPATTLRPVEPTLELVPIEEDPQPQAPSDPDLEEKTIPVQAPSPGPTQDRKRRAEAVRGAVIVSQDGATVHYKKKCSKCGYEAISKNSMPIRTGSTTASFFCPKCKKLRDVVIRGSM